MVPVNEVTPEGQPRLWIRDLPPTSNSGAPEITQPRIYFGESRQPLRRGRAPTSRSSTIPSNSSTGAGDPTTSWTGQTGIPLDSTLSRLLFALRFRDLDLLITDQVQADSQLLFHRTISERLGMIAPFLRYDKDPYLVVVDGQLVYVQDAYTLSDRFPNASWFDTLELGADDVGPRLRGHQLHPQQRQDHDGRLRRHDALLRRGPDRPADPRLAGRSSRSCSSPCRQMPAELQAHLRVPEELFNVQTRMYGQYHVTDPLTFFNNTDRWTVPDRADEPAEPAVRGVLRRDADARRAEGRVPAAPADDRRAAGRT